MGPTEHMFGILASIFSSIPKQPIILYYEDSDIRLI